MSNVCRVHGKLHEIYTQILNGRTNMYSVYHHCWNNGHDLASDHRYIRIDEIHKSTMLLRCESSDFLINISTCRINIYDININTYICIYTVNIRI